MTSLNINYDFLLNQKHCGNLGGKKTEITLEFLKE